MKRLFKRILALSFAFVICFSCVTVPTYASEPPGIIPQALWDWIGTTGQDYVSMKWWRDLFNTSPDAPATAYNDYTKKVKDKLGTTQVGSNGFYLFAPGLSKPALWMSGTLLEYQPGPPTILRWTSGSSGYGLNCLTRTGSQALNVRAPVDGYYTWHPVFSFENARFQSPSDGYMGSRTSCVVGQFLPENTITVQDLGANLFCSVTFYFRWFVEPVSYNVNDFTNEVGGAPSRPSSLVGNLGYYGDDGKLIIAENAKLVDETNNKFYNPVTNTTSNVTSWNYDYSDRSYHLTLEGDKSSTVTYGDEYVTIKEGDTIYNIYYVTQGGGGTDPDPGACEHTYTDATTTAPTCTTPGLKTSTCSKCSKSTTAPIPALGHTWVVERTVQTTYDESGALVQKGYTIYKCSVCNEQYKDENGTGPPGSGGGSGEESGGNWFTDLLKKIGEFLGTVIGGLLEIIGNALLKILDSLITLVTTAVDKLTNLVNLFGSFGEALRVLWTWLPEEIITVIVASVTVVLFVAVLKIFIK